jgi:hypothetical protein
MNGYWITESLNIFISQKKMSAPSHINDNAKMVNLWSLRNMTRSLSSIALCTEREGQQIFKTLIKNKSVMHASSIYKFQLHNKKNRYKKPYGAQKSAWFVHAIYAL